MKIVYFFQFFATREMSGITRTFEFTRRLAEKGHEVHVVTTWHRGGRQPGWHVTNEDGVHVHWLTLDYDNKMSFVRRLVPFLNFALRAPIRGFKLAKGADALMASSPPLTIAMPGLVVSWLRRIPLVLEVRDVWPDNPIQMGILKGKLPIFLARLLERIAYRRSRRIVALSPGMRDAVIANGAAPDKLAVIPNSSDLDMFGTPEALAAPLPDGFPDLAGRKLVLYTGTLGFANSLTYLVDVAAQAKARGDEVAYLVVGTGMEEARIRERARERGVLGDNFHMLPPVPKTQVPALMARADLSVTILIDNPVLWVSSPNKFFDTLAAGKPIAINYRGWKADIIEQEGIGLTLPADDPARAAAMIGDFLADDEAVAAAGRRARRIAEERFDRDKLADQLEQVFLSLGRRD